MSVKLVQPKLQIWVCAPSKHCAKFIRCNPSHGAPSRRALQRFLQCSDIGLPSSPRRVAAKLTGGVLKFAQQQYIAHSVACGRETPSNHRTNCNHCNSCRRLRAGTPSVTCGDSSLQLREPRICANLKVIIKAEYYI